MLETSSSPEQIHHSLLGLARPTPPPPNAPFMTAFTRVCACPFWAHGYAQGRVWDGTAWHSFVLVWAWAGHAGSCGSLGIRSLGVGLQARGFLEVGAN